VISSSQRPLPDNTQHSQQTNIQAPGGIRTNSLSRRAAAELRLRPRGHWDRQLEGMASFYRRNADQFNVRILSKNDICSRTLALSRPRQWKYFLFNAPQFPQDHCFLEGSQTWPFVFLVGVTGKLIRVSSTGKMVVKKENRNTWRKTFFRCRFVHHEPHMCWDRTRAYPVTGRRQTAWMLAQPKDKKAKAKQSHYRPGQAQRVPGS